MSGAGPCSGHESPFESKVIHTGSLAYPLQLSYLKEIYATSLHTEEYPSRA